MRRAAAVLTALVLAGAAAAPAPAADPGRVALGTHAGITTTSAALSAAPVLVLPGAADPAWSPDGTQLAFARSTSPGGLGIAAADGSGARAVTTGIPIMLTGGFADSQPAWSPDGTQLLFVRSSLRRSEIWTVAADGSGAHRLIAATGQDHIDQSPRYLADGSGLTFDREGDLWRASLDGGHLRRLLAVGLGVDAIVAPGGRGYAVGRPGDRTYLVGAGGGGLRAIGGRGGYPLAFSSDGRRLVLGQLDRRGRVTRAATVVRTTGAPRPQHPSPALEGLGSAGWGPPAWFAPSAPRPGALPPDHAAPRSAVPDDRHHTLVAVTPRTAHRVITWHLVASPALLTVDQTGIRSISVLWKGPGVSAGWHDVTAADSVGRTVPRTPGRYRLLIRATDVLGHASRTPARITVDVVR